MGFVQWVGLNVGNSSRLVKARRVRSALKTRGREGQRAWMRGQRGWRSGARWRRGRASGSRKGDRYDRRYQGPGHPAHLDDGRPSALQISPHLLGTGRSSQCETHMGFFCNAGAVRPALKPSGMPQSGIGHELLWRCRFANRCRITMENIGFQAAIFFYQVDYTLTRVPKMRLFPRAIRRVNPVPYGR